MTQNIIFASQLDPNQEVKYNFAALVRKSLSGRRDVFLVHVLQYRESKYEKDEAKKLTSWERGKDLLPSCDGHLVITTLGKRRRRENKLMRGVEGS